MPQKEKIAKAAEHSAFLDKLDKAPLYIKSRSVNPSNLPELKNAEGSYGWKGLVSTDEGNLGFHPKHGSGGNKRRQTNSIEWARKLAKDYPKLLWARNGASAIAKEENVHASTVRRAKRKLKQNEQAK